MSLRRIRPPRLRLTGEFLCSVRTLRSFRRLSPIRWLWRAVPCYLALRANTLRWYRDEEGYRANAGNPLGTNAADGELPLGGTSVTRYDETRLRLQGLAGIDLYLRFETHDVLVEWEAAIGAAVGAKHAARAAAATELV